ncbi:uncharacterized protein METZ01_LOCUS357970, partial [marine metagenome]
PRHALWSAIRGADRIDSRFHAAAGALGIRLAAEGRFAGGRALRRIPQTARLGPRV